MEGIIDTIYIGMAAIVYDAEDGLLFGNVESISGTTVTIAGLDQETGFYFCCKGHYQHDNLSYMRYHPYSIPQLIDIALTTGDRTSFMEYTQFMIEWEDLIKKEKIRCYIHPEEELQK